MALVLKQGDTLVGYMTPSACGSLSFVPADGLSAQSPSISNVSTVRVGNYVLDSADTSSSPTAAQIAGLRALLNQKSRPPAAAPVNLSLGLTMQAICSPPPAFAGKIKIDGSATSGATVQRSIGGSILAQYTPQAQKPGAITPRLRYIMSYGDTVKGDTTSKSSQIHWGQVDTHIRLRNQSASLGPTSVYISEIAISMSLSAAMRSRRAARPLNCNAETYALESRVTRSINGRALISIFRNGAIHYGLNFLIGFQPKVPPALLALPLDLGQPLVRQIPLQRIRRQVVGSAALAGGQLLSLCQKIVGDVEVIVRGCHGRLALIIAWSAVGVLLCAGVAQNRLPSTINPY